MRLTRRATWDRDSLTLFCPFQASATRIGNTPGSPSWLLSSAALSPHWLILSCGIEPVLKLLTRQREIWRLGSLRHRTLASRLEASASVSTPGAHLPILSV